MLSTYNVSRVRPSTRQLLRSELLAVNRSLAGWLGLNPRYTISSNIAQLVARALRIPYGTAKQWFHAGVAGFASLLLRLFGLSHVLAVGLGVLALVWLESFDGSQRHQ